MSASTVKAIPDDYPIIAPYLCVGDGAKAIDFYMQAFGASVRLRMDGPGGKVMHAELALAGGLIMLADEFPQMNFRSPQTLGGSPVGIHVYVTDVDALATRAVAAGGKLQGPVETQFYGDRTARIMDPFGHLWHFATHVEDVSPEETRRRHEAMASGTK